MTSLSTMAGIILSVALAGAVTQDKAAPAAGKAQDQAKAAAKQATITGTPVTLAATVEAIDVADGTSRSKGQRATSSTSTFQRTTHGSTS
jgi:hypothetical protein